MERKKIAFLLVMVLLLGLYSIAVSAEPFIPKQGQITVKEVGDVKFHTYSTPLAMGAGSSHVIETKNVLIMVDTLQNKVHNDELKAFVHSLGKPLQRIIISHAHEHHWLGLEMFPGIPIHSFDTTFYEIREKGNQMLQAVKARMGEEAIPYKQVVLPNRLLNPGDERIDGVLFRYLKPTEKYIEDDVLFIEFPEQRSIILHHLAYAGLHLPLPPIPPRLESLKLIKEKNYNWVMAGHGIPTTGADFADKASDYLTKAQKIIQDSPDVKTAKENLLKEYPSYGAPFFLDFVLPAFYTKTQSHPLNSLDRLKPSGVVMKTMPYKGRDSVQVKFAPGSTGPDKNTFAYLTGANFHNGTIEVDVAGTVDMEAPRDARGFVGIAFRIPEDLSQCEGIYIRPTNGRAEDQVRRNHSIQYFSFPDWSFARFRKEAPERYESYVDLVPGAWTKIRIEVEGSKARLYVHGGEQPVLIVNDLKLGDKARGSIGLFVDAGTEGYFSNLKVTYKD